jgi:PAS domain S-box-containing protein
MKRIHTEHGKLRSTLGLLPDRGETADYSSADSKSLAVPRIAREPLGISLFENAPANAVVLDRQLDIVYANTGFTRVFGSVPLLTSRAFQQFVIPEDADRVTECALMSVCHPGTINAIDFHARTAEGRTLVMSSRWRYSEATDTTIVHLYDVTEQKNEERELLAVLSESDGGKSTVGIAGWSSDVRTGTIYCSREWAQIYGLDLQTAKLERATWMSMIHPDDRANIAQLWKNVLSGEDAIRAEFRVVRPDGSVVWLTSRGHVVFDSDHQPIKVVGGTVNAK